MQVDTVVAAAEVKSAALASTTSQFLWRIVAVSTWEQFVDTETRNSISCWHQLHGGRCGARNSEKEKKKTQKRRRRKTRRNVLRKKRKKRKEETTREEVQGSRRTPRKGAGVVVVDGGGAGGGRSCWVKGEVGKAAAAVAVGEGEGEGVVERELVSGREVGRPCSKERGGSSCRGGRGTSTV